MLFKNFFRKKTEPELYAETPAVQPKDYDENFAEISGRLRKIENAQKEMSLQLDALDALLQDDDEHALAGALIEMCSNIENFYRFTAENPDSPLYGQARMMWDAAKNAAEPVGLEFIDDERVPFDFRRHSAEITGNDALLPNGYIIKILKCGYAYKGKVIRRALAVVNKSVETQ